MLNGRLRGSNLLAKTGYCKLQPNRQYFAATWRIQTSDSAFCQIALVIVIVTIMIVVIVIIKRLVVADVDQMYLASRVECE